MLKAIWLKAVSLLKAVVQLINTGILPNVGAGVRLQGRLVKNREEVVDLTTIGIQIFAIVFIQALQTLLLQLPYPMSLFLKDAASLPAAAGLTTTGIQIPVHVFTTVALVVQVVRSAILPQPGAAIIVTGILTIVLAATVVMNRLEGAV